MARRRDVLGASVGAALSGRVGAAEPGWVEVIGRRLVYRGRPLQLRGVAVGDPLLGRGDRPVTDFVAIAQSWAANVARLSVHPSSFKRQRTAALAALDRDVRGALASGLFVIIDWHTIGWPDGWFQRPDPSWGQPTDLYDSRMALAADFWATMARRYGQDGRILFELWNEPIFHPDRPGDPGERWAALVPSWRRLLAAIRPHARNLVLLAGDRWAYDLRGIVKNRIGDPNLAYAWHVYANHDDNQPAMWRRRLGGLHTVAPVIVTEWGFATAPGLHFNGSAATFGDAFVELLRSLALHDTAWCWHPDWTPAMLTSDWRTPTVFGSFVRERLRGLPTPVRP